MESDTSEQSSPHPESNVEYLGMDVHQGHLREVRRLARLALTYFLHYIGAVDKGIEEGLGFVPKRKQLLDALEVSSAKNLKELLGVVPESFPNVQAWQGYYSR